MMQDLRCISLAIVCAALPLFLQTAIEARAQESPAPGPRLDEVPGPAIDRSNLPPPAQWPVLRYESPLRILVVTRQASLAAYQRIARRMRSTVEFRYEGKGGDSIYHVNDKWIEPEKN